MRENFECKVNKVENGYTIHASYDDTNDDNGEYNYKQEVFIAETPRKALKLVRAWFQQFEGEANGQEAA